MACASTGALRLAAPAAGSAGGQDASLPVAAWAGATLPAAPAGGAPVSTVAAPAMTRPATHRMTVRIRLNLAPPTITTQSYTGRSRSTAHEPPNTPRCQGPSSTPPLLHVRYSV